MAPPVGGMGGGVAVMVAITLLIADALCVAATGVIQIFVDQHFHSNSAYPPSSWVFALGVFLCLALAALGHYTRRRPLLFESRVIILSSCITGVLDGYLQLATTGELDRVFFGAAWVVFALLSIAARLAAKFLFYLSGFWRQEAILIGGKRGIRAASRILSENWYLGYKPVLEIDIEENEIVSVEQVANPARKGVAFVVVDESTVGKALSLSRQFELLCGSPPGLIYEPDMLPTSDCEVHTVIGSCMFLRNDQNALMRRLDTAGKRMLDFCGAIAILFFTSPIFLVIALLNKMQGGSIFYGSKRIGRNGKIFSALKFRTMVPNAEQKLHLILKQDSQLQEEWNSTFKLKNDPRITPIGKFLRESSLDELPQLINVLKGEMSLVGPRPILPCERDLYTHDQFRLYCKSVPGLTGLWQVSGRNNLEYHRRIELNMWYIRNRSILLDVFILTKTILTVSLRANVS